MADENKPLDVAENLVADTGNMTVSTKLMKYAIGILIAGTLSILTFAYGLYWKAEDGRKKADESLTELIATDRAEILTAIKELEKEEVDPNTKKNIDQDLNIMLVMERTNTLGGRINGTTQRPTSVMSQPTSDPSTIDINIDPTLMFNSQNISSDSSSVVE